MNVCWFVVAFTIAAASSAYYVQNSEEGSHHDRYQYPSEDIVDSQEPVDEASHLDYKNIKEHLKIYQYDREAPGGRRLIDFNNIPSGYQSHPDVVLMANGWLEDSYCAMIGWLLLGFSGALTKPNNVTILWVDWTAYSTLNFTGASKAIPSIAMNLAELLTFLIPDKNYDRLHLVGYDLGAHIVGIVGRKLGGKVRRITALDPAGWSWSDNKDRLRATDAQYVEVIHTSVNSYGIAEPCGDADIYYKGGNDDVDCEGGGIIEKECTHFVAYVLMFESLIGTIPIHKCTSYEQARANNCTIGHYELGNADYNKNLSGIFA